MTTKELIRPVGSTGGAPQLSRSDAVGIEIPVVVHASRSSRGLDKNHPPVHEETRTVIVLSNGAVVRMTASLTSGETVVLTNRQTGADVLCRVGKVKAQPGIQQYVDLEFTQRAPSFWGDCLAGGGSAVPELPAAPVKTAPLIAQAPVLTPAAPASRPVVVASPAASPVVQAPLTVNDLKPSWLAESVAPSPADLEQSILHDRPMPSSSSGLGFGAPVARAKTAPSLLPSLNSLSEEPAHLPSSSGSKMGYLAVAALALIVVGASMGGWLYRQGLMAPSVLPPQQQQAAAFPFPEEKASPQAVTEQPYNWPSPSFETARVNPSTASAGPAPSSSAPVSITPSAALPAITIAPAPAAQPAVRRNSIAASAVRPPVARRAPIAMAPSEAPPVVAGPLSGLGELGTGADLLTTNAAGPAPPRPTAGGQLQPPQLISSAAPIYPPSARAQRIMGAVVLDALVDETGKVVESKVIVGHLLLRGAAQEALRNWKYQPARLNGEPIAVHTRVTIRFNLN